MICPFFLYFLYLWLRLPPECVVQGKWIDEIYRELCDPKAAARWYPLSDAGRRPQYACVCDGEGGRADPEHDRKSDPD